MQFGHPGYENPPPELPPFALVAVHVHVACGHWQSTLYVVPSVHVSLSLMSHEPGPPLPPAPLLLQ